MGTGDGDWFDRAGLDRGRCRTLHEIYRHRSRHGLFEIDPLIRDETPPPPCSILGLPHWWPSAPSRVLGYAYAGNWRPRPAHRYSVEDRSTSTTTPLGQGVSKGALPVPDRAMHGTGKRARWWR